MIGKAFELFWSSLSVTKDMYVGMKGKSLNINRKHKMAYHKEVYEKIMRKLSGTKSIVTVRGHCCLPYWPSANHPNKCSHIFALITDHLKNQESVYMLDFFFEYLMLIEKIYLTISKQPYQTKMITNFLSKTVVDEVCCWLLYTSAVSSIHQSKSPLSKD